MSDSGDPFFKNSDDQAYTEEGNQCIPGVVVLSEIAPTCQGDKNFKDQARESFTEEGNHCVVPQTIIPKVSRLDFINLSFEDFDLTDPVQIFTGGSAGIYWINQELVPGWNGTNFDFLEIWDKNEGVGGGAFLEINSDGRDTIFQEAAAYIVKHETVEISFYVKNRNGNADDLTITFEILTPFPKVLFEITHTFSSFDWEQFTHQFTIPPFAGNVRLSFASSVEGTVNSHLDEITFTLL